MTLYDLSAEYQALLADYDAAADDAEAGRILDCIAGLEYAIEDKADAYARIMKNYDAEAKAIGEEIKRLQARKKAAETAVERMKGAMLDAMRRLGLREMRTGIGKWQVQSNPWKVTVPDESLVPKEWRKPQPDKIDIAGIRDHFLETGEMLPGCEYTKSEGVRFR